MNISEQIINDCFGQSIQKVYPFFVYKHVEHPQYYFLDGLVISTDSYRYYGKAWCKLSPLYPFTESCVPLTGDRIKDNNGDVFEIVSIETV